MTDFILCCVAGCVLLWVVYLKLEIGALQRQQVRFIVLLDRQIRQVTGGVEYAAERKGWGKRAQLQEVDLCWVKNPGGSSSPPAGKF